MSQKRLVIALTLALLASPALAAKYKVDGMHSSAVFKIKHFNTSNFYGTFGKIDGTISYDGNDVAASSIEVAIASASAHSGFGQRDDHIKSPDFLNAKQFPAITFKSKSVKAKGNGMEIKGDLTLHGVTKEITVMADKTGEGTNPRSGSEIIGFEARFTVDRSAFDMGFMVGPLGKDIDFILALEAVKQ